MSLNALRQLRAKSPAARAEPRWKRPLDLLALSLCGVLLSPAWLALFIAAALAIRRHDGGPVFYSQERLGRGGRVFRIYKFRTMRVDAERETGPIWARVNDDRITPPGRWLRATRLDEAPQALNILRGDMSLVGPRPERPEIAARIARSVPGWDDRLATRPGLAGLSQVRGGSFTSPRNRLRWDRLYIRRMSPALDARLALASLCVALRGGRARLRFRRRRRARARNR